MGFRRNGRRRVVRRPPETAPSRTAAHSGVVPVAAPRADDVGEQIEQLRRECEVVRNDLVVARTQLEEMTARLPRASDPSLAATAAATSTGELPALHPGDIDLEGEPEPEL